MIEIVYLENSLYIKKQLMIAYDEYLERNLDMFVNCSFKTFVEKAFTGVLNWTSFDKPEEDNALDPINFNTELAEDLLDSIRDTDIELITDWRMYFKIEYIEEINSIKIDYDYSKKNIILPDPASYKYSYDLLRKLKLTKLARLLNELRSSKTRDIG